MNEKQDQLSVFGRRSLDGAVPVLCADYAGLLNQGLGLAEAAGLAAAPVLVRARRFRAPALAGPVPAGPVIAVGGAGARAAVRLPNRPRIQVQHPRLESRRFDLIVANQHDELTGPNVMVVRTAMHRMTPARLAAAAAAWGPVFGHLPRPLVAVLVGGSNGRFRLGAREGAALGEQLTAMMRRDGVGVALTPSRRTGAAALAALRGALPPAGAWVWDGSGENPYAGLLACADAIVATIDSISMVSEACATAAPVLLAGLPGRSRRIGLFLEGLRAAGRVRDFAGRFAAWPCAPLDDTPAAGAAVRRLLAQG